MDRGKLSPSRVAKQNMRRVLGRAFEAMSDDVMRAQAMATICVVLAPDGEEGEDLAVFWDKVMSATSPEYTRTLEMEEIIKRSEHRRN